MYSEDIDRRSISELEYMASIYMQHGELDRAAEIMALAEDIERRMWKDSNIAWLDDLRHQEKGA